MPTLIDQVLKKFKAFNGNASATTDFRFKRIVQETRQGLLTFSDMPIQYAIQDRNLLLQHGAHSQAESLDALNNLTKDSSLFSVKDLLLSQPMKLTALGMGNIGEKEARKSILRVSDSISIIDSTSDSKLEPAYVAPVVKIEKPVEIRKKNPRVGDPNDAVVLSIIAGVATVPSRVILGLLGQMLHTVAYNELRTSRQLGYVVNAGSSQISNVQFLSCTVQGIALKADAVEGAIEHVYTQLMPKRLNELTEKEFKAYKDSMRQELIQPPMKFQDEVTHFWGPVSQGGQCFDLRSNMLKYLDETLTSKDHLVQEWARLISPSQGLRSKIVVKYFAGNVPPRPSEAEAASTWKKQGVAESAVALLRREYQQTTVFDRVDSETRKKLAKAGGFYPKDMNCHLDSTHTTSGASIQASASPRKSQHALRHNALEPK
jgi:secreted Zn-dependent insulinase-like peptidase